MTEEVVVDVDAAAAEAILRDVPPGEYSGKLPIPPPVGVLPTTSLGDMREVRLVVRLLTGGSDSMARMVSSRSANSLKTSLIKSSSMSDFSGFFEKDS